MDNNMYMFKDNETDTEIIYVIAQEGRNHCCLTVKTCPELYAKTLKDMGFEIEENRNNFNTLCGYYIKWN